MKKSTFVIPLLLLATSAIAQNPPPRPGPGGGPPDRLRDRDRDGGLDNSSAFIDPARPGPGPGGRDGAGRPGNPLMMQVELMRNWLDLIDRYARLSRDPVSSAVAAVVSADDLMRSKPPEEAIAFFNKMLDETKNDTVKRAIRLQLAELYGKANQPDKALEHLRKLMTETPTDVPQSPPTSRQP